jgi:hypothetical protein
LAEAYPSDRRCGGLFGGVLRVIDLAGDPLEIYPHLREIGLPRCDFLLPDGTRDHPLPVRCLIDDELHTPIG